MRTMLKDVEEECGVCFYFMMCVYREESEG